MSLFSTKTRIYKQKTHTYTKWRRKLFISSLFDYYKTVFFYLSRGNEKLSVSRAVSQVIMRGKKDQGTCVVVTKTRNNLQ